jgi:ribosome-binding factor A
LAAEAMLKENAGGLIQQDMEEGKRQKQIAGLLNEEINLVFQRLGLNMMDGGMVSISSVKITPDLHEARFYISFFKVNDVDKAMQKIEERHHEIKRELVNRVRHQLRSIPVLNWKNYLKKSTKKNLPEINLNNSRWEPVFFSPGVISKQKNLPTRSP